MVKKKFLPISFLLFLCLCPGCREDSEIPINDITAEVSEAISTVITVRWTTEEATTGYVQFGPTSEMEFSTPIEEKPALTHEALLLGMPADTKVFYRVVLWDGDEAGASKTQTVSTGHLPTGMPYPQLVSKSGEGHDQYTIVPITTGSGKNTVIAILNPKGQIIWYHKDNRPLQFFRARLSEDGKSIIYNALNLSEKEGKNSELVRVSMDGTNVESIEVPQMAHDFIEMEDGTIGAIVAEYRDFNDKPLRGDKIVEISPDGTQKDVWSTWDCFDPKKNPTDGMEQSFGWTWANALDYYENQDAYYISFYQFSSIIKVDRRTGECPLVFGGIGRNVEFESGVYPFLHEHQFELLRNGNLLVFDNDGLPGKTDKSRVIEYEFDQEKSLLKQVWEYIPNPGLHTLFLGEVTRFDDGDTLISWGTAGVIERVTSDNECKWKVKIPDGSAYLFGFHTTENSLYRGTVAKLGK